MKDDKAVGKHSLVPFLVWIFFTCTATIAPLIFNYALERLWNGQPTLLHLISGGELYIIACAIAAHAFGDLIAGLYRNDVDVGSGVMAAFLGLVAIVSSVLLYGALRMGHIIQDFHFAEELHLNDGFLQRSSYFVFVLALGVGLYAVWLQEPHNQVAHAKRKTAAAHQV